MNYTTDQIQSAMERAEVPLHQIFHVLNILAKIELNDIDEANNEFIPDNVHHLLQRICMVENVDLGEVLSGCQSANLVKIRAAFSKIARDFYGAAITEIKIARACGLTNHCTVNYHIHNAEKLPFRAKEVAEIKAKIKIKCDGK